MVGGKLPYYLQRSLQIWLLQDEDETIQIRIPKCPAQSTYLGRKIVKDYEVPQKPTRIQQIKEEKNKSERND